MSNNMVKIKTEHELRKEGMEFYIGFKAHIDKTMDFALIDTDPISLKIMLETIKGVSAIVNSNTALLKLLKERMGNA